MKKLLTITLSLAFAGAALLPARAQYINDGFESYTLNALIPATATPPGPLGTRQATNALGNAIIGTGGKVAWMNDTGTGSGQSSFLEYNAGASALGSMYVSFDLYNRSTAVVGLLTFGVGNWSTATGNNLNSSSKRAFAVDFYQGPAVNTNYVKLRSTNNMDIVGSVLYDPAVLQQVKIWANDNDTTTLAYTRPDGGGTALLSANSVVVWINGSLVGTESASGFGMSIVPGGADTTGNATLGRVGFTSTTANTADFYIDNLYVSDPPPVVPEPTACVLMGFAGLMLAWARRSARR